MDKLILKLKMKKFDKSNLYQSIIDLHKQCTHAYQDAQKVNIPNSYKQINKILIAGMGGSGLGARAIKSIYHQKLKYPILRLNNYKLPQWVDDKTLVICSSYSGSTEEIVNVAKQCVEKKLKWMAIATGKDVLKLAQKHRVPIYNINPKYNPSGQPRMAIGYSLVGQLVLISKTGAITFTKKDLDLVVKTMESIVSKNNLEVKPSNNSAKQLAKLIVDKQVIFSACEHLAGTTHTIKNQMNENAKHLAHRHDIPELNHHLMEGLKFPQTNQEDIFFLLFQSSLYHPKNQKRVKITQKVLSKNNIDSFIYQPQSSTRISQAFEIIQFGAFVNFYLTLEHNLDPAPIPWVDYFKAKMKE